MVNQSGVRASSTLNGLVDKAGKHLAEFARRTRLARAPGPEGVSGPPARLLFGEVGEWSRRMRRPGSFAKARNPQPVMLVPGFAAHPRRMRPMQDALEQAGHRVDDWGLGFNTGPTPENFGFLMDRVSSLARANGQPIALVGWSLGGLFVREIACQQPENVSRVITMGTPFSGDPHANNAWRAYQFVTGYDVEEPPIDCADMARPPVSTVALWSQRDGAVHPRSAAGWPHERDRAVALRCTHLGFSGSGEAIEEVLRQLDEQN